VARRDVDSARALLPQIERSLPQIRQFSGRDERSATNGKYRSRPNGWALGSVRLLQACVRSFGHRWFRSKAAVRRRRESHLRCNRTASTRTTANCAGCLSAT